MHYETRISTPASTAQSAPVRTELRVSAGVIVRIGVSFPPGPQASLHVRVRHGDLQIFPTNPGGDVAWDDITVDAAYHYPLTDEPFLVVIETWNDDASNDHECRVAVNILPAEAAATGQAERNLLQRIGRALFGG